MTKNIFSEDVDAKLLDTDASRYDLAKLTAIYTNILKNKPELSSYHVPQLIKKALDDILSGAVTPEEIISAHKIHSSSAQGEGGNEEESPEDAKGESKTKEASGKASKQKSSAKN